MDEKKERQLVFLTNEKFYELINSLHTLISTSSIDITNIFHFFCQLIEMIDKFKLDGTDKAEIVSEILYLLLEDQESSFYDYVDLSPEVRELLSNVSYNFIECILKLSKKSFMKGEKDSVKLNVEEVCIKIYNAIKRLFGKEKIETKNLAATILAVIMGIMGLLETESHISNRDKKTIAMKVLNKFIYDQSLITDENQKEILANLIDLSPGLIDVFKDVSNGKFDINSLEQIDPQIVSNCMCSAFKSLNSKFKLKSRTKTKSESESER